MNKLVDRLLADRAVVYFKDQGEKTKKPATGWVVKVVMGFAVLMFLAYLAYKSNSRSKELAKLKHERDVAKEDEKQAKLDWELALVDDVIEEKLARLVETQKALKHLDTELKDLREEAEYEGFKIEAIDNWDDMDAYLNALRAASVSEREVL